MVNVPRAPFYSVQRGSYHDISLRTWIGTPPPSPFVPPVITYVPRAPLYVGTRGPEYHVELRSWFGNLPPGPAVVVEGPYKPAVVLDWGLPPEPPFLLRTWIGTLPPKLPPIGELSTILPIQPVYPISMRGWAWNYNLNLVGQDRLPTGEAVTDLAPRGYTYPVDVRTITASLNIKLAASNLLPTGEIRTELARGYDAAIQFRSWTWSYNRNLVGKDRLPFNQDYWPLPTLATVREANLSTWAYSSQFEITIPNNQSDWPITRVQASLPRTWTWFYNLNLIGKDALPKGAEITALPPQPPPIGANQLRTWLYNTSLALTAFVPPKPFNQFDWPTNPGPRQPIQVFTASFNKNLIGKDALPFHQHSWPVPTPFARQPDLASWIDRVKLLLQIPLKQTDWPIPRTPQQPALFWAASYNKNLINKDKLPFRQTDWPLTADNRRYIDYAVKTNPLIYVPTTPPPPFKQLSWPLPQGLTPGYEQRYSSTFQGNFPYYLFVSPIPPVPPPTPPDSQQFIYNPGNEWQMLDRIREPGPVGWR